MYLLVMWAAPLCVEFWDFILFFSCKISSYGVNSLAVTCKATLLM